MTIACRYGASINDVIKSHSVLHTQHADDIQLYIRLSQVSLQTTMSEYFAAVHHCFSLNGIALNPDKSDAIVVDSALALDTGARVRSGRSD